jgi:PHP family Zn ribbon phosphoesterase
MRLVADLHIHSRYSRAASAKLSPPCLDRWARIKGIDLLGTGDCTHPRWLGELREALEEAEEGLYVLKEEIRAAFERGPALAEALPCPGDREAEPRFVLSGEISTIYRRGGKTRKIHHLVILPDFRAAAAFQARLAKTGNIASDGRPILGIDSRDLLGLLLDTDERSILIPAHIWTPWFSVLGAGSGFDSIEECYGDLSPYIPAVETGLSSNPPMNRALSALDAFSIVSNSDAHSPDKLGREATILDMDRSWPALKTALRRGIAGTIELFPQEGKYHYDGHRTCGVFLKPGDAAARGGLCPVCGRPLTRGVMGRVLELADRPVDETGKAPPASAAAGTGAGPGRESAGGGPRPCYSLIPLKEILGELLNTRPASKKAEAAYASLIRKAGSEFALLMDMSPAEIETLAPPGLSGELLALAIRRMRAGDVSIRPGYDGKYGIIRVFPPGTPGDVPRKSSQLPSL